MAMQVAFVHHRDRRDRVYVTRPDGSSTAWDFPSYGDRLPHDLCHLVVEEGLGIVSGFWGLVEQGVEVQLVDDQATLVRDGKPLVQHMGIDFSDLMQAEAAVALLGPTGMQTRQVAGPAVAQFDAEASGSTRTDELPSGLGLDLPPHTLDVEVAAVRQRLDELAERWRRLDDGEAITLTYHAHTS
jgi:hypothetical protein